MYLQVHYEGGGSRTPATDVICPMYARPHQTAALASDPKEHRPVILCEYAHSMGNSTGNVHKYWDVFRSQKRCQGGFIWDWVDQALLKPREDGTGKEYWAYGGDFGDEPNDAQFVCNGVLWPDRTPKPAAEEMKAVQAPIEVRLADGSGSAEEVNIEVAAREKEPFIDLDDYVYYWRLLVNGREAGGPSKDGWHAFKLASEPGPRTGRGASLDVGAMSDAAAPGDRCIEIKAVLASATPWAPAGYPIYEAHLPLEAAEPSLHPDSHLPCEQPSRVEVSGSGDVLLTAETGDRTVTVTISGSSGCVVSYRAGATELLTAPVTPCFYRAATDNDRGGSGGASYAARWKAAGLDRLKVQPGSCSVAVNESPEGAEVVCGWTLVPGEPEDGVGDGIDLMVEGVGVGEVGGRHWLSDQPTTLDAPPPSQVGENAEGHIRVEASYRLLPGGALSTRWNIDATHALPAHLAPGLLKSLARVGLELGVPAEFQRVQWYGRGPHECYPDRKAGAPLRHYSVPRVADLHVPYVFPSESGGRCDVRWAALHHRTGGFVVASADARGLQFSASPFSVAAFDRARHDHELVPDAFTHVHLDAAHMGVGGDDSWSPSVHKEYLVPPGVYRFEVVLGAVGGEEADVADAATQIWRAAAGQAGVKERTSAHQV